MAEGKNPEILETFIDEAIALVLNEEYAKAVPRLNAILDIINDPVPALSGYEGYISGCSYELLAKCYSNRLSEDHIDPDYSEKAYRYFEKATEILEKINDTEEDFSSSFMMGDTCYSYGAFLEKLGKPEEALEKYKEAIPFLNRSMELPCDDDDPDPNIILIDVMQNLSILYYEQKDYERAKATMLRALPILDELIEDYPEEEYPRQKEYFNTFIDEMDDLL